MTNAQAYAIIFQWSAIVLLLVCYLAVKALGACRRSRQQARRNAQLDCFMERMRQISREQLDAYRAPFKE